MIKRLVVPDLEEIEEVMNRSLEESNQKALEESRSKAKEHESDDEDLVSDDMDHENSLVQGMSGFCLIK